MFKILIPTDFSPSASTAIKYAMSISGNFESLNISLFHCIDTSDLSRSFIHKIEDVLLKEAEEEMKKIATDNIGNAAVGTKIDYDIVFGEPEEQIINKVKENKIDLIVMGTQGAGGMKELFFGSNTSKIVEKNTFCPLIVVPQNTPTRPITHIVYASDLADLESEAALIIAFGKLFNAHVTVLHLTDDPEKEKEFNQTEETEKLIQKFHYPNLSFQVKFDIDVLEGIENFLIENKVSMVALFSRRKTAFEKLLDKSFTREMSLHTHIPMLVMPYDLILD
ncbi:MAG: universal stress protein [Bacteroidota bacterium]|nr:universal stress protein [Bacteroidota bacterium]